MLLSDKENKISVMLAGGMLGVTLVIGAVLASGSVNAEEESVVSNVSVTVTTSCTFQGIVNTAHTANIENGTVQGNIGSTTLKAFCNDNGGFSIHAIGYTDEEYGKTVLSSQAIGDSVDIATGTGTSGASSWAMKLDNSGSTAYPVTLDNNFGSYSAVPTTFTKVAHRDSGTYVGTSATGALLTTTYQVYVSSDQPADNYVGKVKYTMVHPSAEKPNQPVVTSANKISYNPNASGLVDTMGDQSITDTDTSATLWASNFQRPGYGFAGWNDKFDMTGTNYGPNEDITFTAGQYSEENGGLSLYANWIKSAGTMQDWDGCSSLAQGDVTALTDSRDSNTYAVAKLADGKCWMIENLRLADKTTTSATTNAALTTANTNKPLNTDGTVTLKNSDGTTTDHLSASTNPTTTAWCTDTNSACYDQSMLATNNTTLAGTAEDSMTTPTNANVYSYGNYYNWYSATAGNGTYSTSTSNSSVGGDLCPAGWSLPKGGNSSNATNSDFWKLGLGIMGAAPSNNSYYQSSETNAAGDTATKAFRKFPNNFLYSGSVVGSSVSGRGRGGGFYWSSTAISSNDSYYMSLNSSNVDPGRSNNNKYRGFTVRCLIGS